MRRLIATLSLCAVHALAAAAGAPSPIAPEKPACEWQSPGGDFREFKCPIEASAGTGRYRFKAHFSGGHDDTSASMVATLNGEPLACETGSKLRLFGEDGDVSLECRFSIAEKAGQKNVLGVALLWSHAQYTGIELVSD